MTNFGLQHKVWEPLSNNGILMKCTFCEIMHESVLLSG
jgi:hypothetical protein